MVFISSFLMATYIYKRQESQRFPGKRHRTGLRRPTWPLKTSPSKVSNAVVQRVSHILSNSLSLNLLINAWQQVEGMKKNVLGLKTSKQGRDRGTGSARIPFNRPKRCLTKILRVHQNRWWDYSLFCQIKKPTRSTETLKVDMWLKTLTDEAKPTSVQCGGSSEEQYHPTSDTVYEENATPNFVQGT